MVAAGSVISLLASASPSWAAYSTVVTACDPYIGAPQQGCAKLQRDGGIGRALAQTFPNGNALRINYVAHGYRYNAFGNPPNYSYGTVDIEDYRPQGGVASYGRLDKATNAHQANNCWQYVAEMQYHIDGGPYTATVTTSPWYTHVCVA